MKRGKVIVSTEEGKRVEHTDYVVYSYDKNNFKFVFYFPELSGMAKQRALLILSGETLPRQRYTLEINDGKSEWVVPAELLGYEGHVKGYLHTSVNGHTDGDDDFMFTFLMRRSEKDKEVIELQNTYYDLFDDAVEQIQLKAESTQQRIQTMYSQAIETISATQDKIRSTDGTIDQELQEIYDDLRRYFSKSKSTMDHEVVKVVDRKVTATSEIEQIIEELRDLADVGVYSKAYVDDLETTLKNADSLLTKAIEFLNTDVDTLESNLTEANLELTATKEEINVARGESQTLGERLDEDKAEVTTQLAQNTEDISKVEKETIYNRKSNSVGPMVSFQSDDGPIQDYTIVFPYAKQKNVPFTLGIINNSPLPVERILELQNEHGWDVHSHTVTHPRLSQISPEQLDHEMKVSKEYLQSIGVKVDSIMYPYGDSSKEVLDSARKYYRAGFGSEQGINRSPIDTYSIKRVSLDNNTVERCKQYVDEIGDDGWIVFYTHPATMVEGQRYAFMDLIDYVQEKDIEIVTCGEALDVFENRLSIGNKAYNGSYAFIGADGTHDFSSMPIVYRDREDNVNTKPITDYTLDKITMNSFKIGTGADIPLDAGVGTLVTNRMSTRPGQEQSNFQIWYGYLGSIGFRNWGGTNWNPWQGIGGFNTLKTKEYTNDSPITDFPSRKVTSVSFLHSDNGGFPTPSGTLSVSRVSPSDNRNFQLWYPFDEPNVFYRRTWGVAWSVWSRYSAHIKHNTTYNFGSLAPSEIKKVNFTVEGARIERGVTVSFAGGIADAVIPVASVLSNDTVEVKLTSVSLSQANVGNKAIVITVMI